MACACCGKRSDNLPCSISVGHTKKMFCSEHCLETFRKKTFKAACSHCGSPVQQGEEEFCSATCAKAFAKAGGATEDATNMQRRKRQYTYESSGVFDWDEYLKETHCEPAPQKCFKQSAKRLENNFALNMKLEALDSRNTTSTCIATIVAIQGPRLRLRLDGGDDKNDFWRLVDSNEIHPVGYCKANGGMLQPPLGFRANASMWPVFLQRTMKDAVVADKRCFLAEPSTPKSNLFRIGQKLEAIDRKNPHLICPATVGATKDDMIFVTFDGWRGAFDYWCRFDSRDIFPVGWCRANAHPLQPPGNKAGVTTTTTWSAKVLPTRGAIAAVSPSTSTSQVLPSVCVYVNSACNCGPFLNTEKVRQISPKFGPAPLNVVLKQLTQTLIVAAINQKTLFMNLKRGNGKVLVEAQVDGKVQSCRLPSVEKMSDFWQYVESLVGSLMCCEQFLTQTPPPHRDAPCLKCAPPAVVKAEKPSTMIRPTPSSSNITTTPQSAAAVVQATAASATPVIATTTTAPPTAGVKPMVHSSSTPTLMLPPNNLPLAQWSTDHVTSYIQSTDGSLGPFLDLFRKHEIDGKAFSLLTSDMMMRYMGLKLGPALKICHIIEKCKSQQTSL